MKNTGVSEQRLKECGAKIREYREKLGYSRRQVAKLAPVNESYYRDIEMGRNLVSIHRFIAICKALKIKAPEEMSEPSYLAMDKEFHVIWERK